MTQNGVRCKSGGSGECREDEKKVSKPTLVYVLIFFVFLAGVFYIFQVNRLATMGYEIKSKEKAVQELKRQNEALSIRAARLKSMHNLEAEKERMNMKKPEDVSYAEIGNPMAMGEKLETQP